MIRCVCNTCGNVSNCSVAARFHILTNHLREDVCVPVDLNDNGRSCLLCLINDTISIGQYFKKKKEEKKFDVGY